MHTLTGRKVFHHVAIDAEFLKMGGSLMTRSVAFVPFPLHSDGPCAVPPASVVQLSPEFVSEYCDLLPAGYSLREHCASFSDGLERFFPPLQIKSSTRQLARQLAKQQLEAVLLTEDVYDDASSKGGMATAGSRDQVSIDPYMVPNCRLFCDGLASLYSQPVDTEAFRKAARLVVSKTFAYGTSKQRVPAIGSLIRRDSSVFQLFLRHRFATEQSWVEWLEAARTLSCEALHAVSRSVKSEGCGDEASKVIAPVLGVHRAMVKVVEHTTLDYSRSVRQLWSGYMVNTCPLTHRLTEGKFYAYGGADLDVLRQTVRLACSERRLNDLGVSDCGTAVVKEIQSPMQIAITDVTRSSAFRAMGFELELGLTPRLRHALEKVQRRNDAAGALLCNPEEHNPLWDAAALAAVCQVVLRR
jgi:hypothetical protein